ncbi:MAG TPA: DUF1249 domain-containing protein [Methylotenera sp.]|nr:DUF1249 domain-containing protein [Methylotenera sp.]
MNFNAYMACCSTNYQRMRQLMPLNYNIGETLQWDLGAVGLFEVILENRQTYTDVYRVGYQSLQNTRWLANFVVQLKLYHDASLAEVTAYLDPKGKMQAFSEPAPNKLPYWEKWQMNQLICDALQCCLSHKNV